MSLAICMMNIAGPGQSKDNGTNQRTAIADLEGAMSSAKSVPSASKSSHLGPDQHFQG